MDKCKQCGKVLTKDEIGLHRKLFNRMSTSFLCIDCCAAYLEVSKERLQEKIKEFKEMGCTLFQ